MRDDDYQSYADELAAKTRRDAERDHNYATAGIVAGQAAHPLTEQNNPETRREKKEKEFAALSSLARRLTDPTYAAFYNDTMDMLAEAEKAADQAMAYFAAQRAAARQSLKEMLESATYLKGHGAVFRDGDTVRLLDGTVIDDQVLLDSIVWKDNSPDYQDVAPHRDNADRYDASYNAAYHYRTETLGDVREEMENEDNDVSKGRMEELRDTISNKPYEFSASEIKTTPAPDSPKNPPSQNMSFSADIATPVI